MYVTQVTLLKTNIILALEITLKIYNCPLHGNNATGVHSSVEDSDILWYDTVSIGYYLLSFVERFLPPYSGS
jgi:hypothetical protein